MTKSKTKMSTDHQLTHHINIFFFQGTAKILNTLLTLILFT